MFDRNSLVTQLGWRLGIVLSIGALLQTAWLFAHFRGMETADAGLVWELLDFFKDVAWTTPAIGITTFIVCAAGMRRHLEPLRQLSEQAAQDRTRRSTYSATCRSSTQRGSATRSIRQHGFRALGRRRAGAAALHGQCCA